MAADLLRCGRCDTEKAEGDFPPSVARSIKAGKRGGWCSDCYAKYQRERMNDPQLRQEQYDRQRAWRQRNCAKLDALKAKRGCDECGEKHVACLDFHHRDQDEKNDTVSRMVSARGWKTVLAEIEKCDLLCANCHRKRHFAERTGGYMPWSEKMDLNASRNGASG